jgi:hypothetical protein
MVILILRDQYNVALGINTGIWGVVGTIIGYYFGSKQGENAAKLISQTGRDLIDSRNREIKQKYALERELKLMERGIPITRMNNNNNNNNNQQGEIGLNMNDSDSEIIVPEI